MAAMGFSSQSYAPFKSSSLSPPYFCFCRSFPFSTSRSSWAASRILPDRYESYEVHASVIPFSNSPDLGNSFEKISTYRRSRQPICGYPVKFEAEPVTQNHTTLSRLSLNQQLASAGTVSSARDQYHVTESPVLLPTWTDEAASLGKEKENYSKQRNGGTYFRARVGRSSNVKVIPNCVSTATSFPSDPVVIPSPVDNKFNGFPLGPRVEEQESSVSISDADPIRVSSSVEKKLNGFSLRPCMDKQEGSISIAEGDNVDERVQNQEKSVKTTYKKKKVSVKTDEVDDGQTQKLKLTEEKISQLKLRERLGMVYEKVLIVDTISSAKEVVSLLTSQYRHLVHACDTEVSSIDVKQETPVDHGEIICFSIYSGPAVDFGNGKSCIWVDVLNGGGKKIVEEFAPFFESPEIKKVWHNYSFDCHVIKNYGVKVAGFHADTMHMARLWDSSRRTEGGYSLEALTGNSSVMSGAKLCRGEELIGKVSMKTIFGRKKLKKDGSEGKVSTIPSVEELQTTERELWICYSALDSISTLKLYQSLGKKLSQLEWKLDGVRKGSMFNFYEKYWRPFGELLVTMESHGMQVDRSYLAEIEKVAIAEQRIAADRFRNWASKYCPDAKYMNVGSDMQLRQLFFGGIQNAKDPNEFLPVSKEFKIPNVDLVIEDGKKAPKKYRAITLRRIFDDRIDTDMYTPSGWPSVSGDALKALARKYAVESEPSMIPVQSEMDEGDLRKDVDEQASSDADTDIQSEMEEGDLRKDVDEQASSEADTEPQIGAADAISALIEVCSIDSLISNFILPLQGPHIAGKNLRVHCSLNINTETGRLSARRPNLQNQPALEKDRYKIRQAFIAEPGNSLIVADYGQLELRILAHLANCKSMLDAFEAGGDFHSRTAMNMYPHIRQAIQEKKVLLEWHPQPGEDKPPVPLLKDAFASERRKAKMLNFSIAYGKTPVGLARDWKVSVEEAKKTVNLWYSDRKEVLSWQEQRKAEARKTGCVHTLLGRARLFPSQRTTTPAQKSHIDRAAINTPVQGSAADVAMCAMLQISREPRLKKLGWKLLLQVNLGSYLFECCKIEHFWEHFFVNTSTPDVDQSREESMCKTRFPHLSDPHEVHDEVILEGPTESAEIAKDIVVDCMSKPFDGKNILKVDLAVDAKCAKNWYAAK